MPRIGVAAALILALATFAEPMKTAPVEPRRGEGAAAASGFAVSDIRVELAADSRTVSAVSFALDPPAAALVRIRVSSSGPWFDCEPLGGAARCQLEPAQPVSSVTALRVVAAGA